MVTFKDAKCHVAIFPEEIPEFFIKSGCPENGIILDPFMGSGTTAKIAKFLNKNYIGFDIISTYCDVANKRIQDIVCEEQ